MDIVRIASAVIFDSDDGDNNGNLVIPRPRFIRDRSEHFTDLDNVDFVRRFRLSKRSCLLLLDMIDHRLEFPSDKYYATGCTQISASDFSGVSESTAHRIIHRVTAAIVSLYQHFIFFPQSRQEMCATMAAFYMIARFPRVVGAIDCTHVKIRSPGGEYAEYFRNRKAYFSINVQGICNADLEFLDIVARWPGSSHDQTIFDHSRQRAKFENNEYGEGLLVGDSAYATRSYMMPPLDNPVGRAQNSYNESQIRTRNPIERIFGVWKRRFPVLALGINVRLENAMPIIVAAAILFNFLRRENEPEAPNDPELTLPMPWEDLIARGQVEQPININNERARNLLLRQQTRQTLINDYFANL